ncbi:PREDICTED: heme-binding protein 1-like, partial [Buceros rhinoceros silvestris]|uniref:heme-binding protein 1-like n=1 Tax=Buceros rhinoceros silvestris TaxID=175836 RepID=UPI0005284069
LQCPPVVSLVRGLLRSRLGGRKSVLLAEKATTGQLAVLALQRFLQNPCSRDGSSCKEAYEERQYPAGKWACVTKGEPMYEQSISMSFMKLMRYICKENSVGCYLGMTVPVLSEIHLTKEGTELEREVVTAYYLPGEFQQNPPVPMDPEIHITERAPLRVISRVFYGMTTEDTILREISLFWELLGSTDTVLRETYIVAAYENPSIPQRRNEIWFICRAE